MDYAVKVTQTVLRNEIMYKNRIVVSYCIRYPHFSSDKFTEVLDYINNYYESMAQSFKGYCEKKLYCMAIDSYEYNRKKNYPIHKYEGDLSYTVTYNKDCAISLYFDGYEFTGGAHGFTHRCADTWNLEKGECSKLEDFFIQNGAAEEYILDNINQYIAGQMAENGGVYFEDYIVNTKKYFNPENFYITQAGVVIFYEQYEIAPYSSGIKEFLMRYSDDRVKKPKCYKGRS